MISGDRLLRDTCTLESYTAPTYTVDTGDDADPTYGTAATLACLVSPQISRRWETAWPNVDMTRSIEVWLPSTATVKPQDRLTHGGLTYQIVATAPSIGIALQCLAERKDNLAP